MLEPAISGKSIFALYTQQRFMETTTKNADGTQRVSVSDNSLPMQGTLTGAGFLNGLRRISWSAVFAGVLVAVIAQIMLSLLGLGIGLSTIDPLQENNPMAGLGTGAAVWYGISTILSLLAGGWVAGRMAGGTRTFDNTLHGILTWSITTLLTFYLLTTAVGGLIGGATRFIGGAVKTVGSAVGSGASAMGPQLGDAIQGEARSRGINLDNLRGEVTTMLRQTKKAELQPGALQNRVDNAGTAAQNTAGQAARNPQDAGESADALFDRFFKEGEEVTSAVDRDAMANVIMARTGQNREQAYQTVDNWTATYNKAKEDFKQAKVQAEQKAREMADKAAAATSRAAIFAFFGLLLGMIAAAFAARKGGNSRENISAIDRPVRTVA